MSQNPSSPAPARRRAPPWSNRAAAVFAAGLAFISALVSGLVISVAPSGRIAREIDWAIAWLGRDGWEALHLVTALAFAGFAIWHIVIHAPVIYNLLFCNSPRVTGHWREAFAALTVMLVFVLAAILDLPPASWIVDLNDFFKRDYWAAGS